MVASIRGEDGWVKASFCGCRAGLRRSCPLWEQHAGHSPMWPRGHGLISQGDGEDRGLVAPATPVAAAGQENLVPTCCGGTSLHPGLLECPGTQDLWKVLVHRSCGVSVHLQHLGCPCTHGLCAVSMNGTL